jgi:ArsR family transcriptional regulator
MLSVLKALSDRNRLRILAALVQYDELCACQIIELLQVKGATASRHLGILISAGWVESRRDGRWINYRLRTSQVEFIPVMAWMKEEFLKSQQVQEDLKLLEKITAIEPEELCRRQRGIQCCPE